MNYHQEIENYIWARLSAEKAKDFERRMKEDESLSEEVAMQRRELELIRKMEEEYWLREMKSWKAEMSADDQQVEGKAQQEAPSYVPSTTESTTINLRLRASIHRRILTWSAAAAIALLLTFYWLLPSDGSFSIIEERVIPDRYISVEKSSEKKIESTDRLGRLFIKAYDALEDQRYNVADETFETIESIPEAEQWLLQAVEYNRALIKYEQGDREEAMSQLKRISEYSSHRYRRKAEKLLKKLQD